MSRSYRTQKESVIARRNIRRDPEGSPVLPRLIQRKPHQEDVHALPKQALARLLTRIPQTYLYGLSRIELRARSSKEIGQPFGLYLPDEKAILLYSLPTKWELDFIGSSLELSIKRYYGNIIKGNGQINVSWPNKEVMGLWFYCYVFTHELGHHYRQQYRYKRKSGGLAEEELVADLHAKRITDELFKNFKKRKAQQATGGKP